MALDTDIPLTPAEEYSSKERFIESASYARFKGLSMKPAADIAKIVRDTLTFFESTEEMLTPARTNSLYDVMIEKFRVVVPRYMRLKEIQTELEKGVGDNSMEAVAIIRNLTITGTTIRFLLDNHS